MLLANYTYKKEEESIIAVNKMLNLYQNELGLASLHSMTAQRALSNEKG